MYFALFRCMRIDQDRVGETTSMYANRPRSCLRNDLDVCESTCMRNDRLPHRIDQFLQPTIAGDRTVYPLDEFWLYQKFYKLTIKHFSLYSVDDKHT